jgi:hypothetical protein
MEVPMKEKLTEVLNKDAHLDQSFSAYVSIPLLKN